MLGRWDGRAGNVGGVPSSRKVSSSFFFDLDHHLASRFAMVEDGDEWWSDVIVRVTVRLVGWLVAVRVGEEERDVTASRSDEQYSRHQSKINDQR